VLVADRGLCGGYNSSVLRAAEGEVKRTVLESKGYGLVLVGRKAETYFRFRGYDTEASFSGFSERPTYADAKQIAATVMQKYAEGAVDRVEIIYTRFISATCKKC
jgi:F-type H+-transporting ATPase subunit gamma